MDFEVANLIGSHWKKHQVTAFYWLILNIPPEFLSKLSAIQLLALAKSSDVKKYRVATLLHEFKKSLQTLWTGTVLKCHGGYKL